MFTTRLSRGKKRPHGGAAGLSPAQPRHAPRPRLCCAISLLLTCLSCPQGWVTLSRAVRRIPQSLLYSALKITSAEREKEMVLEMEMLPLLWLCSLSLQKSPFRGAIKGSSVATAEKEQLQGRGGSQAPPPGGAICSGKDKKTQIRNQSISALNALVI